MECATNSLFFADDLLLLAISHRDLQLMVNLCIEEFNELDLKINVKKSMCLRIGRNHDEKISPILIDNEPLEWKQEMRYLGVFIVSANTFKCNLQSARQKFFRALNGIFAKIGTKASPRVLLSLVNSFCLHVLLYGVEALSINAQMRSCLDNAFNTTFAKIFSSFDRKVILNCQYYCGSLPMCYRLDCRLFEFYKSLMISSNEYVRLHFLRTGHNTFQLILNRYNVTNISTILSLSL